MEKVLTSQQFLDLMNESNEDFLNEEYDILDHVLQYTYQDEVYQIFYHHTPEKLNQNNEIIMDSSTEIVKVEKDGQKIIQTFPENIYIDIIEKIENIHQLS